MSIPTQEDPLAPFHLVARLSKDEGAAGMAKALQERPRKPEDPQVPARKPLEKVSGYDAVRTFNRTRPSAPGTPMGPASTPYKPTLGAAANRAKEKTEARLPREKREVEETLIGELTKGFDPMSDPRMKTLLEGTKHIPKRLPPPRMYASTSRGGLFGMARPPARFYQDPMTGQLVRAERPGQMSEHYQRAQSMVSQRDAGVMEMIHRLKEEHDASKQNALYIQKMAEGYGLPPEMVEGLPATMARDIFGLNKGRMESETKQQQVQRETSIIKQRMEQMYGVTFPEGMSREGIMALASMEEDQQAQKKKEEANALLQRGIEAGLEGDYATSVRLGAMTLPQALAQEEKNRGQKEAMAAKQEAALKEQLQTYQSGTVKALEVSTKLIDTLNRTGYYEPQLQSIDTGDEDLREVKASNERGLRLHNMSMARNLRSAVYQAKMALDQAGAHPETMERILSSINARANQPSSVSDPSGLNEVMQKGMVGTKDVDKFLGEDGGIKHNRISLQEILSLEPPGKGDLESAQQEIYSKEETTAWIMYYAQQLQNVLSQGLSPSR